MFAASLEQCRHCCRAGAAAFLVMAEGEIDGLPRPEPSCEKPFRRFEDRHQRALVVDRPAPGHEAVGDRAAERRGAPLALAARFDRDDVLMRRKQQGRCGRVATRPGVEEASARDLLALQPGVNQREAAGEKGMEGGERFRRRGSRFGRNGLDLQRLGQSPNGCRIDGQRSRDFSERLGPQTKRVEREDNDEGQQQHRCGEPQPLERLQKSTLS